MVRSQLEGLFLSSLLLQIQKVNSFYEQRSVDAAERLEQLAPLLASSDLFGVHRGAQQLATTRPR